MNFAFITFSYTKRYFCVNIAKLDSDENITYIFGGKYDDRNKLSELLFKYPNLIGYNLRKYDMFMMAQMLYGYISSPEELISLKDAMSVAYANDTINSDDDVERLRHKLNAFNVIDLKYTNSLRIENLLQVGINIGIQDIAIHNDNIYTEDVVSSIVKEIDSKVIVLKRLYELSTNKLKLRKSLSEESGTDMLSFSNSDISRYVFNSLYLNATNESFYDVKRSTFEYDEVRLSDIIQNFSYYNDNISELYNKLKEFVVTPDNKIDFRVATKGVVHKIKQGGMHSVNKPCIIDNKEHELFYIDFNSYYANLMLKFKIKPAHTTKVFYDSIKTVLKLRDKAGNDDEEKTYKNILASLSGNLSYKNSMFRDYKASVSLYLTGQLQTLKIIDELEKIESLNCVMSNTDGIIITVDEEDIGRFRDRMAQLEFEINLPWKVQKLNKLIIKDVNNYMFIDEFESVTGVGVFREKRDVSDSLNAPIIGKAIRNYFLYSKPVEETLNDEKDILQYCIGETPKPPERLWSVTLTNTELIPNTARYYISNKSENVCYGQNKKNIKVMITGYSASLLTTVDKEINYLKNLNLRYYIKEINKIIDSTSIKQQTLF